MKWAILAVLFFAAPLLGDARAGDAGVRSAAQCRPPFDVGFRIVQIPGGPLTAVWYPSRGPEARFAYSDALAGSVARDGRPETCGRFPLLVFSHGLGGCGTQTVFLTEQLARTGYVVAAPDHKDASCRVDGSGRLQLRAPERSFFQPEKWTPATHADRRSDLTHVIDWALGEPAFASSIDAQRVGAIGHSLGGYSTLGMIGGWPGHRDRRIKAALLLSPYVLPFLVQNRLGAVSVPVMYQGAQLDIGITPSLRGDSGAYAATPSAKAYVELRGGTHFEWTNLVCLGHKSVLECLRKNPNAWLITAYGGAFFERYLLQRGEVLARLNGKGLATYLQR
jgi:predicted dienelactone hydrolase